MATSSVYNPFTGTLSGPYGTNAKSVAASKIPTYQYSVDLTPAKATSSSYINTTTPSNYGSSTPTSGTSLMSMGNMVNSSNSGGGYSVSAYFGSNSEAYKKYKEGKAQGKWKDLNDYINKGGTQSGLVQDPVEAMVEAQKKMIDEEKGWLEQYTSSNPFAFDEALARESVTAEYEPYYTELLNDYITDVETNRQTIESDRSLLEKLKGYEDTQASREYTQAVSNAEQGFAGSGMFFSGIKDRAVGNIDVANTENTEIRDLNYENKQLGLTRQENQLDTNLTRKTRDLNREKEAAIESGILGRKSEAITQYNTPLIQSYTRRFGGSSTGLLDGYTVPDYLRY